MKVIKQISSLEKVRTDSSMDYREITHATVLQGERFSYQIAARGDTDENSSVIVEIVSPLADWVKVFYADQAVMDCPFTDKAAAFDLNYITKTPGLMPDILVPIEERNSVWIVRATARSLWIEVNVPANCAPGSYEVTVRFNSKGTATSEKTMTLEVLDQQILPQSLIYTRWFYADCIADYHNVEVYSEEHWNLIEKYLIQAADSGINMILVPVHTPPLDTAIGHRRTCVQLVDIKKEGDSYSFSFDKFFRFISLCKRAGIRYFEIAHMFSQWGAHCAPNIMVEENGKKDYMFGWHVAADSDEYISFLKQYIAAISGAIAEAGITKNTYFHISDEPVLDNMSTYRRASEIIRPLIGESKTFDALSNYAFYEQGLVEIPVTSISHMEEFLGKGIKNQWLYYCCDPQTKYPNSTMAMPSARVRILGLMLYKYDIKGFLHWGLNFYNAVVSRSTINPYTTTSCDGAFPSGDAFILYPAKDGAYSSIRAKLIFEAINDLNLCRTLETIIGRDAVIALIDSVAGTPLTFETYPVGSEYLLTLREKMTALIKENI